MKMKKREKMSWAEKSHWRKSILNLLLLVILLFVFLFAAVFAIEGGQIGIIIVRIVSATIAAISLIFAIFCMGDLFEEIGKALRLAYSRLRNKPIRRADTPIP